VTGVEMKYGDGISFDEGKNCILLNGEVCGVVMSGVEMENIEIGGKSMIEIHPTVNENDHPEKNEEKSVSITNCIFSSLHSSSLTGGAVSIILPSSWSFGGEEIEIVDCWCSIERDKLKRDEWGRGGGMYLNMKSDSSNIQLSEVSFEENDASVGRDVYLLGTQFVTIVPLKFDFMEGIEEGERENSFWGEDKNYFTPERDVFFLLREYAGSEIHVGGGGRDSVFCGEWYVPCLSFEIGLSHLLMDEEGRERDDETEFSAMSFKGNVKVDSSYSLRNVVIQSCPYIAPHLGNPAEGAM
jgi:hypothetical protein